MSNIICPLIVAPLGKSTLRFFRSPLQGANFPWHSFDDLMGCVGLSHDERHIFRRGLSDWRPDVRTVATADGIVTIAPHFVAQGLIGAMIEFGCVGPSFENAYAKAGVSALSIITEGWLVNELLAFMGEAHWRNNRESGQ